MLLLKTSSVQVLFSCVRCAIRDAPRHDHGESGYFGTSLAPIRFELVEAEVLMETIAFWMASSKSRADVSCFLTRFPRTTPHQLDAGWNGRDDYAANRRQNDSNGRARYSV
jgi:hypothetical protein